MLLSKVIYVNETYLDVLKIVQRTSILIMIVSRKKKKRFKN